MIYFIKYNEICQEQKASGFFLHGKVTDYFPNATEQSKMYMKNGP